MEFRKKNGVMQPISLQTDPALRLSDRGIYTGLSSLRRIPYGNDGGSAVSSQTALQKYYTSVKVKVK